jgi:hypothetical protein
LSHKIQARKQELRRPKTNRRLRDQEIRATEDQETRRSRTNRRSEDQENLFQKRSPDLLTSCSDLLFF